MNNTPTLAPLLTRLRAADVRHGHRTLADHLEGTAALAAACGETAEVITACAAHSIYGTSTFPTPLPLHRDEIRALVGETVERYVYAFHRLKRGSRWVLSTAPADLVDRFTLAPLRDTIQLSDADVGVLKRIEVYNLLEQGEKL